MLPVHMKGLTSILCFHHTRNMNYGKIYFTIMVMIILKKASHKNFSMMEAIVNTGRENNITYHPIMDNYPEYGNISKTKLNENYAATDYAMTIEEGFVSYENT